MKRTITIICDIETTVPHLLNSNDFEIICTSKDDVFTMVKKEQQIDWTNTPSTKAEDIKIK